MAEAFFESGGNRLEIGATDRLAVVGLAAFKSCTQEPLSESADELRQIARGHHVLAVDVLLDLGSDDHTHLACGEDEDIRTADSLAVIGLSGLDAVIEPHTDVLAEVFSKIARGHHVLGVHELLHLGGNDITHRNGGGSNVRILRAYKPLPQGNLGKIPALLRKQKQLTQRRILLYYEREIAYGS